MNERRSARRYDLSLPILIRTQLEEENASPNGTTRDISTRGVYFMITKELTAGAELDITLTLPAEITRGSEVFVRAVGRVIRVDKQPEGENPRIGVAAVIERYEIVRNEQNVA